MGCGKTSIGKLVSDKMQMKFLDLDQFIESRWGSIPSLFEKGEDYFRDIESQAVSEVSEMEGLVIATGGGVVKRGENMMWLKKKGLVIFIDRPLQDILSDIRTTERPLLKDGKNKLEEIFRERYPLYINNCDVHLKNDRNLDDAVQQIILHWE